MQHSPWLPQTVDQTKIGSIPKGGSLMKKSEPIARIAADAKIPRAVVEKTITSFTSYQHYR